MNIWEKSSATTTTSSSSGEKRNVKDMVLLVAPSKSFIILRGTLSPTYSCIDCNLFGDSLSCSDVRSRAVFISREKEIMFE